jgi:hypothetical protein
MSRGTTLADLRTMIKSEVGDYSGTNSVADAVLNKLAIDMQSWLSSEYDWPFLEHRWDAAVAAGQQFVAIPTADARGQNCNINFERPVLVERYYNTIYDEISYGIGAEEYNVSNIVKGQSNDPIQKWRMASNSDESANADQIEVWPVPVSAQTIRFTAQRKVYTVATDNDKFDLDDLMIALLVAGEKLTRSNQADGDLKLKKGQRLLERLRQHYPVRARTIVLGGDSDVRRERKRLVPLIVR